MNSTQHHRPLVLGIESSCDETGVGIVRGTQLLTNTVSSSMDEHVRFGGVIPEIASRAHLDAFVPTLREALAEAGVTLEDIDAIAVTSGPGLAGALMVGVCAAKALAVATGKPLYAINHLVAHVGVGLLQTDDGGPQAFAGPRPAAGPSRPCRKTWAPCWSPAGTPRSCGSGTSPGTWSCWGPRSTTPPARPTTRWRGSWASAIRAARPSTSWHAPGNAKAIRFPRGLSQPKYMGTAEEPGPHRYDWSFSGLKTAVARCVEQFEARGETVPVADIAAAFQEAVVDIITSKAVLACRENGITELLLGGGVAANSRLRQLTEQRCSAAGIRLTVPPLALCTDNGAMVAALGAQLVMAGIAPSGIGFAPDSSMPVTTVSA